MIQSLPLTMLFLPEIVSLLDTKAGRASLPARTLRLRPYFDNPEYLLAAAELRAARESSLDDAARPRSEKVVNALVERLVRAAVEIRLNVLGSQSAKILCFSGPAGTSLLELGGSGWVGAAAVSRRELDSITTLATDSSEGFVAESESLDGGRRGVGWDGLDTLAVRHPDGSWKKEASVAEDATRFLGELWGDTK